MTTPRRERPVPLTIVVGLNGGPPDANGRESFSGEPTPNEKVSATDASGHVFTAESNADGLAIMHLKPGRYKISSEQCGDGYRPPHAIVLSPNRLPVLYQIECGIS